MSRIRSKFFCGGHDNMGSMADFDFIQEYVKDLVAAVDESFSIVRDHLLD